MTQAVLLGQADLAAAYKMQPRMSPEGKREFSWQSRTTNGGRADLERERWAVIVEGRKKENTYLDVDRLQAK